VSAVSVATSVVVPSDVVADFTEATVALVTPYVSIIQRATVPAGRRTERLMPVVVAMDSHVPSNRKFQLPDATAKSKPVTVAKPVAVESKFDESCLKVASPADAQVLSPLRNVEELAVPVPSWELGTLVLESSEA
jgi:hypothetical protein